MTDFVRMPWRERVIKSVWHRRAATILVMVAVLLLVGAFGYGTPERRVRLERARVENERVEALLIEGNRDYQVALEAYYGRDDSTTAGSKLAAFFDSLSMEKDQRLRHLRSKVASLLSRINLRVQKRELKQYERGR